MKFTNTDKCYINKQKAVIENDTYKIFWDFDIQTEHTIHSKIQDFVLRKKKKRTCQLAFDSQTRHSLNTWENKKWNNIYNLKASFFFGGGAFKMAGVEARRQLHKNIASNIEQVLAATPHKAPTIQTTASHYENYPS